MNAGVVVLTSLAASDNGTLGRYNTRQLRGLGSLASRNAYTERDRVCALAAVSP